MTPSALIKDARTAARLTQAELARRLETTQSAIARLERDHSNPRVDTLVRALAACGQELSFVARPRKSSVDETLVSENLKLTSGERIERFERSYASVRDFAMSVAQNRVELA
jgi:transcriptional regulator with XRE-family HTH domain